MFNSVTRIRELEARFKKNHMLAESILVVKEKKRKEEKITPLHSACTLLRAEHALRSDQKVPFAW